MRTDVTGGEATRGSSHPAQLSNRLRATQHLQQLARLWPSLDDDDRADLESHLHRLRERATA